MDLFAASLLILYFSFLFYHQLSLVFVYFLKILSETKGLSDASVVLITKKVYGFLVHFLKIFRKSKKPISNE